MICRSHYTTLHDACVLFDRVLTPFILLFFLQPFPTPSPNELRDRDDKEHVNNFCLRVELPHRADLCFIFSMWQRRSCQPTNCDRSARRHDFLRILVTRYYHHGSGDEIVSSNWILHSRGERLIRLSCVYWKNRATLCRHDLSTILTYKTMRNEKHNRRAYCICQWFK